MPFKKGHKVEPHWHRPVGAENGLSTEAVSRTRLCTIRRNITTWCRIMTPRGDGIVRCRRSPLSDGECRE